MKTLPGSGVVLIIFTLFFTISGQLLIKRGMNVVGVGPSGFGDFTLHLIKAVTNPFIFGGFLCATLAAFSWMSAVSRCELSFAYPFMGLAIVLTMALSSFFFGDKVSANQWLGVVLVVIGIWVTSRPA